MERDDQDPQSGMLNILIFSFGFKHGPALDAQLLFDVRFLPNPYWEEELRPKSGLQPEVSAYVIDSAEGQEFLDALRPLLDCIMKQTAAGEKEEIRVGIGCTGGRHRSVAVVEYLADHLRRNPDHLVRVVHRDIGRD